ncbi:DUF1398 family protein [Oligoflexus tunisiensis]|uniref:DUF1398 family protein n=1 Tax=Oligoflexus tunisiensis TaxID=708132 RepID=UPI00114D0E43|nr:DUF1398 family protein [Oligoflexus tunisiensis]
MNISTLKEVIQGSWSNTLRFPEVVGKLMAEGVESYHVDLVRAENRYYTASGQHHVESVPFPHPTAAQEFSAEKVAAAVRSSQAGEITYPQFLQRIMDAGTVYYIACLAGRRVIYLGRKGDCHVEHFPPAPR